MMHDRCIEEIPKGDCVNPWARGNIALIDDRMMIAPDLRDDSIRQVEDHAR